MKNSKRVLWEVRQRYGINHTPATPSASTPPPSIPPPETPPPRTPRKPRTSRPRPRRLRRVLMIVGALLIASGGIFGYKILAAGNKISVADRSILGQLKDLLFASNQALHGEKDGRINILLMAVGGEGHKGENLADTIMVASIRPQEKAVALLSIPRDLYVQVPGEEYFTKINAIHAYGESKKKDQGPELLRQQVETITGVPMHYFARADFIAFKSIVDAVGGVDIKNENSFYDYWHKISFPAGTEHMDGERALAFVRARYIDGAEGGDFRRAARQQQVLLALQEKVFSAYTAFDFTRVNAILDSLADNVRTDMQLWEMKRFYELARTIDRNQVHSVVLSTGPKGVLVGSTEVLGGTPASVLRPRTGDFSEIQSLAQNIFTSTTLTPPENEQSIETTPTPSPSPSPSPSKKPTMAPSHIEIRNGTTVTGLASRIRDQLQGKGLKVTSIGNAAERGREETTIYILNDEHSETAKRISELIEGNIESGLPQGEGKSQSHILIILGLDAH